MKQRQGGKSYELDMEWAKKQLLAGLRVFCIRALDTGLIAMLIASDRKDWWQSMRWDEVTLTEITMVDGEPKWGDEMAGPCGDLIDGGDDVQQEKPTTSSVSGQDALRQ